MRHSSKAVLWFAGVVLFKFYFFNCFHYGSDIFIYVVNYLLLLCSFPGCEVWRWLDFVFWGQNFCEGVFVLAQDLWGYYLHFWPLLWSNFSRLYISNNIAKTIISSFVKNSLNWIFSIFRKSRCPLFICYRFTSILCSSDSLWSCNLTCFALHPTFFHSWFWSWIFYIRRLFFWYRLVITWHIDVAYFLLKIKFEAFLMFAWTMLILPLKFIFQIQMIDHRIIQIHILQQKPSFRLISPLIKFFLKFKFPPRTFTFNGLKCFCQHELLPSIRLYLYELFNLGRQTFIYFFNSFFAAYLWMIEQFFVWVNNFWQHNLCFL